MSISDESEECSILCMKLYSSRWCEHSIIGQPKCNGSIAIDKGDPLHEAIQLGMA